MSRRRTPPARGRPGRPRGGAHARMEHREQRKHELLDAALEAIRQHGPHVSMEQVAAAAGVTKPVLYRHVGGREALVAELTERFVGEVTERVASAAQRTDLDPRAQLTEAFDAYLELIERDTDLYRFLLRRVGETGEAAEVLAGVIRDIAQIAVGVIGEQLREISADSGAAEPWGYGIVGMVHAAGDWWLDHRTMPRARLVDYLVSLAWDGMVGAGLRSAAEAGPVRGGSPS